jgi:peptidyl-prolyl cis-trans isomerase SurA
MLLCMGFSVNLFAKSSTASSFSMDSIVAIVNDDVITQTQLDKQIKVIKAQLKQRNVKLPADSVFKQKILQQLIDKKLQLQLAKNTGIRISNSELQTAIQQLAKQNKTSVSALYKSVEKSGLSTKEFRQEIKTEALVRKLLRRDIASRISISEQEVNDFLSNSLSTSQTMPEYHLLNILIALPDTPTPDQIEKAKTTAEKVLTKLKAGADFNKTAVDESGGNKSLQGGDLGWRKLAELPVAFANKITTMKPGNIAGPIQTPNGFHIIKFLGERSPSTSEEISEQAEVEMLIIKGIANTLNKDSENIANKIKEKADNNTSFAKLAKKYLKNPKDDYFAGWIKDDQLPAIVEAAIKKLNPGEISQPIANNNDFYLIKIIAKRNIPKSSEAKKKQIEQLIFQRKLNEGMEALVNQLRGQAYIKIMN